MIKAPPLARVTVALIWLWHGIVPKLIFMHADELAPLTASGFSDAAARKLVTACGCVEVALGVLLLAVWRWRWPLWVTLVAMPLALTGVAVTTPYLLKAAFNPATLNLAMFVLAVIALNPRRETTQ